MAVRLTFGCILVQHNTWGPLGSEPSSLHLVQGSWCLLAAGGPWSQESSKPRCYLYGLFCSILLIPLEPLPSTLSPHTQNKDPYESRHTLEWPRDPKAPDFRKMGCKARSMHLQWSPECSATQNTKSKRVEHCFFKLQMGCINHKGNSEKAKVWK